MRKLTSFILLAVMVFAAGAFAATSNPSPASPGYTPMVIPLQGVFSSASHPAVVKYKAPNGYSIVTANATARAVTGTNPTLKVLLKSGVYTNYSGTVTAAGTPKDLVASTNKKIADESTVAVDLVTGGTDPVWTDLTLFILLKRL